MIVRRILEWLPHNYRPRPSYPGPFDLVLMLVTLLLSYFTVVGIGIAVFGESAPVWFYPIALVGFLAGLWAYARVLVVLLSIFASLIGRDLGHRLVFMEVSASEGDTEE